VSSFAGILAVGAVLGVAGASFAVALPLASRWYPPQYQGVALGIAGAGNSGTVFAALFAPGLAVRFGWINVIGLAAIPVAVALAAYVMFAKDCPNHLPPNSFSDYSAVFRSPDTWWFMFFYFVTFVGMTGGIGGFYLASSLGYSKQFTGSYRFGLLVFAILAMSALIGLSSIKGRWRTAWPPLADHLGAAGMGGLARI
jgi:MFS transporter, NNP family, nitrate/nitrite transporter